MYGKLQNKKGTSPLVEFEKLESSNGYDANEGNVNTKI